MTSGVEAAGSVVALIDVALSIVKEARNAQYRVRGTPETLDDGSKQLSSLEGSLSLVQSETSLQTGPVEQQIRSISQVSKELKLFYERLAAVQQRSSTSQFFHALGSGDREKEELQGILDRLDRAQNGLGMRILVTHVGLLGSFQDGFRVAYDVLVETNNRVKEVLGANLALMELVRDRPVQQPGEEIPIESTLKEPPANLLLLRDRTIPLIAGELESLEPPNIGEGVQMTRNSIHRNTGVGYVMTGNVGMQSGHQSTPRVNTIADNDFGKDGRIMTGDLGGEAAASFNQAFWK
ncbi:hypothetical protein ACJ41O_000487 [Fusarium nematophilum]